MPKTVTKYELLLLAFTGAIMAYTGCSREEALRRIATLCVGVEEGLGVKVELK